MRIVNGQSKEDKFREFCEKLKELVDFGLGGICEGFYLFGSSVNRKNKICSDIDFICYLNREIDDVIFDKIVILTSNKI